MLPSVFYAHGGDEQTPYSAVLWVKVFQWVSLDHYIHGITERFCSFHQFPNLLFYITIGVCFLPSLKSMFSWYLDSYHKTLMWAHCTISYRIDICIAWSFSNTNVCKLVDFISAVNINFWVYYPVIFSQQHNIASNRSDIQVQTWLFGHILIFRMLLLSLEYMINMYGLVIDYCLWA